VRNYEVWLRDGRTHRVACVEEAPDVDDGLVYFWGEGENVSVYTLCGIVGWRRVEDSPPTDLR
jgi:hypothetical protein